MDATDAGDPAGGVLGSTSGAEAEGLAGSSGGGDCAVSSSRTGVSTWGAWLTDRRRRCMDVRAGASPEEPCNLV